MDPHPNIPPEVQVGASTATLQRILSYFDDVLGEPVEEELPPRGLIHAIYLLDDHEVRVPLRWSQVQRASAPSELEPLIKNGLRGLVRAGRTREAPQNIPPHASPQGDDLGPLWVIQGNLVNERELADMRKAFRKLGLLSREVTHIPFSDEVPVVHWSGPVIFYGATRFTELARKDGRYWPAAFFNDARFRVSAWLPFYGNSALNADAVIITLKDLRNQSYSDDTELFVRPDQDSKVFAGEVIRYGDLIEWIERVSFSQHLPDTLGVVVAPPKAIDREWRCFIVEGQVVAASQYRAYGILSKREGAPAEVTAFAEARAAEYAPAGVFVLDVANTADGLKVVEAGCFNSAGFYEADLEAIIQAVTDYVKALPVPEETT